MRVKISWDDGATFERHCELADAFCSWDRDGLATAENELRKSGRYWIGGGAQPLGLIMRDYDADAEAARQPDGSISASRFIAETYNK
jgi:hypothetical protein